MNITILSVACCNPGMAGFDSEARKIIDKAVSETGVQAKIDLITATAAYASDTYRKIIDREMKKGGINARRAPVILIDGEIVFYGVPKIDDLKEALLKPSKNKKEK